ncbi:MAG: hypothetical protein ACJ8DJ_14600 [Gemmatimonadales bacterium]
MPPQQATHNIRTRVVAASVKRADANLTGAARTPLPERITPHRLRRTFCSVRYALGDDPGTIADEMGHTDPGLAFTVYRQARNLRRTNDEMAALRALVDGVDWAPNGHSGLSEADEAELEAAAQA